MNNINNNDRDTEDINRQKPDRGVSSAKLITLIIVDLFILSWAIPSLFSVVVSVGGSLFSYIGVLGFLGAGTTYDLMIFWFLTGAYVLLFLFFLVVLEFFIWSCKRTIIWHMKVLRFKKVNEWNKKFSKVSVEGWFKRHKLLKFIKNISGVAAVVVIVYTGFYLFAHYDEIHELYIEQETITETYELDVSDEIAGLEEWNFVTDIDSLDIELRPTTGDKIIITRTYQEDEGTFTVSFDQDTNTATIIHDLPIQFWNFSLSIEDIFRAIAKDELIIEVPQALLIDSVDIVVSNGTVSLSDISVNKVDVTNSNGKIVLSGITATNIIDLQSSNATMIVKESNGAELFVLTSNGKIYIRDAEFNNYDLFTSNGTIELENLNVETKSGGELTADSSNGKILLSEVYVEIVIVDTSNGDIRYFNEDQNFDIDFTRDTSNGEISTNVN